MNIIKKWNAIIKISRHIKQIFYRTLELYSRATIKNYNIFATHFINKIIMICV